MDLGIYFMIVEFLIQIIVLVPAHLYEGRLFDRRKFHLISHTYFLADKETLYAIFMIDDRTHAINYVS